MKFSEELLKRLKTAEKIVFFTGAGISAESGIPTFRGKEGLWKKYKPEELANFDSFIRNPELVWQWYQFRREIVRKALPNNAHLAITKFEKYFKQVTVITQNVDNLHKRAGSRNILELHGNIEKNYCVNCGERYDYVEFTGNLTPRCNKCNGLIRPDVVWFGENLPRNVFEEAEKKSVQSEIFFVIGTSAIVYPAASLVYLAKEFGAYIVEINLEETPLSKNIADETLKGKAGELLPEILKSVDYLKK